MMFLRENVSTLEDVFKGPPMFLAMVGFLL